MPKLTTTLPSSAKAISTSLRLAIERAFPEPCRANRKLRGGVAAATTKENARNGHGLARNLPAPQVERSARHRASLVTPPDRYNTLRPRAYLVGVRRGCPARTHSGRGPPFLGLDGWKTMDTL